MVGLSWRFLWLRCKQTCVLFNLCEFIGIDVWLVAATICVIVNFSQEFIFIINCLLYLWTFRPFIFPVTTSHFLDFLTSSKRTAMRSVSMQRSWWPSRTKGAGAFFFRMWRSVLFTMKRYVRMFDRSFTVKCICLSKVFCWLNVYNFPTRFILQKPERDEWGSGLEAMMCALQLEKNVNQALLDLHKIASEKVDPHVSSQLLPHGLCRDFLVLS